MIRMLRLLIVGLVVTSCGISQSETPIKIALLAPFEGRYREIGYNALYASQLALADLNQPNIVLLPIDDGGSVESALAHAQAFTEDETIQFIITIGPYATSDLVQQAVETVPLLIVGDWGTKPSTDNSYQLSHPNLTGQNLDFVSSNTNLILNETGALAQVETLMDTTGLFIMSSGTLPSDDFRIRYDVLNPFTPEPNLLATLVYDATQLAAQSIMMNQSLDTLEYDGINGNFRFEAGYWVDAPNNQYVYADGQLILQTNP